MSAPNSVLVVGGGIIGTQAALRLARLGRSVTLLDQFDIPNQWAASGDHLRVFRLSYGKDAFYTEMALKALPLWLELNVESEQELFQRHGVLELASRQDGYEAHSLAALKERRAACERLDPAKVRRLYPMYNPRSFRWALFHPDGGLLWASRAVAASVSLAQRKGVAVRSRVRVASVLKDKRGVRGLKDSEGRTWEAAQYLFAGGFWTGELLKSLKLPLRVTKQEQIFLRPLVNRGRYRPEHFPAFSHMGLGFYGLPMHIHGFIKLAGHRSGPRVLKPDLDEARTLTPAFERAARRFLKRAIPELGDFTEYEGHVGWYDNTPDRDFLLDRLPGLDNAYVAAGFSGHGFKFAPLVGQAMAELMTAGRAELNLHRFRLSRF